MTQTIKCCPFCGGIAERRTILTGERTKMATNMKLLVTVSLA